MSAPLSSSRDVHGGDYVTLGHLDQSALGGVLARFLAIPLLCRRLHRPPRGPGPLPRALVALPCVAVLGACLTGCPADEDAGWGLADLPASVVCDPPPRSPPPLGELAAYTSRAAIGPCGDVAVALTDSAVPGFDLWTPDLAERTPFFDAGDFTFAETARWLAWTTSGRRLVVRDLTSGAQREFPLVEDGRFGFYATGQNGGVDVWRCMDETLYVGNVMLAAGVMCRLLEVDERRSLGVVPGLDHGLRRLDLAALRVGTLGVDFRTWDAVEWTPSQRVRLDALSLHPDGDLALVQTTAATLCGDTFCDMTTSPLLAIDLVTGAHHAEAEGGLGQGGVHQPVILPGHRIIGRRDSDSALVLTRLDTGEPVTIATDVNAWAASASGDFVAYSVVDASRCTGAGCDTEAEVLRRWDAAGGNIDVVAARSVVTPVWVSDDGGVLARGDLTRIRLPGGGTLDPGWQSALIGPDGVVRWTFPEPLRVVERVGAVLFVKESLAGSLIDGRLIALDAASGAARALVDGSDFVLGSDATLTHLLVRYRDEDHVGHVLAGAVPSP